jgi:hypothetical protein
MTSLTAEHARLATSTYREPGEWKAIGPYVSERAWGTVREDYSADGNAWSYFPYEHARSRAYRWNEDGLAGICDLEQRMCFALSFWNGRDPFLKERIFGLSGPEGNHGEDAKEYWWYVDATPTASWLQWRYHYPQAEFPYARLREENARRDRTQREFDLEHTGTFDANRYWQIEVDYAKGGGARRLRAHPHTQRRARGGRAARAADVMVPQPLGLGSERGAAVDTRRRRARVRRLQRSIASGAGCWRRARVRAVHRNCCSATTTPILCGCLAAAHKRRIRKTVSTIMSFPALPR